MFTNYTVNKQKNAQKRQIFEKMYYMEMPDCHPGLVPG